VGIGSALLACSVWLFARAFTAPQGSRLAPWPRALGIDLGLVLLFALQHSGMARETFKAWLRQRVPVLLERPIYVVASGVALCALLHFWVHPPGVWWDVRDHAVLNVMLRGVSVLAGLFTLRALHETGGADLLGLTDARTGIAAQERAARPLRTTGTYALLRHPLLLGTLLVLWCWPVSSSGRGLLALSFTLYALWAVPREERALEACYGKAYADYRRRVGRWWPRLGHERAD
jgi:protein-S-isoprenylcysteine O-methyltransferase Ste14